MKLSVRKRSAVCSELKQRTDNKLLLPKDNHFTLYMVVYVNVFVLPNHCLQNTVTIAFASSH